MKRLYLLLTIWLLALGSAFAVVTGFDCEVSDTSPANTWGTWYIIRGESRYLQVNYLQNGAVLPLTNSGIDSVYLSLKASDSTNVYLIAGSVYSATGGSVRVQWSSTNAVPVALYNAEFQVPDVLEVNMAAHGKIKVEAGNSTGVTNVTPYFYPDPVTKIVPGTNVTISPPTGKGEVTINATDTGSTEVIEAGTGITVTTNGVTNTVALSAGSQSSLVLADSAVQPVDTPLANEIAIFNGTEDIDGNPKLTFAGSLLTVDGNIAVTGTVDGVDVSAIPSTYASLGSANTFTGVNTYNESVVFQGGTTKPVTFSDTVANFVNDGGLTNVIVSPTGITLESGATVDGVDIGNTLNQDVRSTASPMFNAVTLTGTTNLTIDAVTLNGTNYMAVTLTGGSTTNLFPLVF